MAAQFKAWICGRSLALNGGRGVPMPPGHGYLFLVTAVCCQIKISVTGSSLVQSSPADCGVPESDREASVMGWPWPTTRLLVGGGGGAGGGR